MDEKIYELWENIIYNISSKNYKEVLYLLNQYTKIESIGITDNMLNIYIDYNIYLNRLDEALKYINILKKYYNDICDKASFVIKYIQCLKNDEAKKILNEENFTDVEYLAIAKQFILYGEFSLAKQCLICCVSKTNDSEIKLVALKEIKKINEHIHKGKFIKQNYYKFKLSGNKLEKGHVIYAKVTDDKYNSNDPKHDVRPYLIWKINGNNVYCFPLTTKIKDKKNYTIYCQNYLNFDSDRRVKDTIVVIKEENIEKVIEKINEKDLTAILKNLYFGLYFKDKKAKNDKKDFIEDYIENLNIEIGDIIVILDKQTKVKKYYYVLGEDNKYQKYKVIEVNYNKESNQYNLLSNNISYINKNKMIFSSYKLSIENQEILNKNISSIPAKYIPKPGDMVVCNGKKLIIIEDENGKFLCSDKTLKMSSSFVMPEYIDKSNEFEYVRKLSIQEINEEISKMNKLFTINKKIKLKKRL